MSTISFREIVSVTRDRVKNLNIYARQEQETGSVIWVGDGIAIVYGIEHVIYGEITISESGVKGVVRDICRNEIGCILFGKGTGVDQDTRMVRTRKRTGVPVGNGFLDRVVSALGESIDGLDSVKKEDYLSVEEEAPGTVDRKSVGVLTETGILAIGSTFPIGHGQRGLIIGDRQTSETSTAMDTILNQKGKDVVCTYMAIGQKASTVAESISALRKNDVVDYTTVMLSTVSEATSFQYIAPYAGIAMAEYFMHQGEGVLIIYDDLSKHTVVYRALSLLLERFSDRGVYSSNVLYLRSRLPEHFDGPCDEKGGGSITALPIIETQAGDVSACIPANVIPVIDGQIFLEGDLFFSGTRLTVNVGLSVSRVGGAAQTRVMKKAPGSIRIDLVQYREMEVFAQFSPDPDEVIKEQLAYGRRLMELLKQPLGRLLSLHEQVVTLCATAHKVMLSVRVSGIKKSQMNVLVWFNEKCPGIGKEIEGTKILGDDLINRTVDAINQYKTNQYKAFV